MTSITATSVPLTIIEDCLSRCLSDTGLVRNSDCLELSGEDVTRKSRLHDVCPVETVDTVDPEYALLSR